MEPKSGNTVLKTVTTEVAPQAVRGQSIRGMVSH